MRQYITQNKSAWGRGPWQDEPDKVQWVDEATDLDCLIVRNASGAWCGYVGVPESHPWFGKTYHDCVNSPPCEESWCGHSPESRMDVHGGITFSDFCHEPTRENWERWRDYMIERKEEAALYPLGDMARAWRDRGHMVTDYEQWREWREAAGICHVPEPGRPERVWWFGFDCAHHGDISPGYADIAPDLLTLGMGTYKPLDYVKAECASLAKQLVAVSA